MTNPPWMSSLSVGSVWYVSHYKFSAYAVILCHLPSPLSSSFTLSFFKALVNDKIMIFATDEEMIGRALLCHNPRDEINIWRDGVTCWVRTVEEIYSVYVNCA